MTLPEGLTPGVWTLDMSHSEIGFSVRHAGISKVRGRFNEASAEARVRESLADASLHATVKTASFDSGDANRDGHVRGPDFFDVEKYPEMTFRATWIRGDGRGLRADRRSHHPRRHQARGPGSRIHRRRGGPLRRHPGRLQRRGGNQPQGIWPDLERRPGAGGLLVSDKVKINVEAAMVKQAVRLQEPVAGSVPGPVRKSGIFRAPLIPNVTPTGENNP